MKKSVSEDSSMLSLPAFQFPAQISLLPQYRFQPHHISHNRPHKAQPSNLHIIKASSTAKIDVDLRPTRERERGFDALLRQWRRPKPITTIRKRLDMDFAVLLMRSGYEVRAKRLTSASHPRIWLSYSSGTVY